MILFANTAEPPGWFAIVVWLTMIAWLFVHIVLAILVGILIFKDFRLKWKMEEDAKQSALDKEEIAQDRKRIRELLTILSGWVTAVESKEAGKELLVKQVARDAQKTAEGIKDTVKQVVNEAAVAFAEAAAHKTVEKLEEKASSNSSVIQGLSKTPSGHDC